jgi:hypothetical protein
MLLAETTTGQGSGRKRTVARSLHLGTVSVKFVFIALLAAVALLYLAQSTQGATRANEFRLLEEKKKGLENDRDRLEIEATRLKSLETLQKDFSTEPRAEGEPVSWERVREVSYLEAPQPVAQNN